MTAISFFNLSKMKQKKILKKVVKQANEDRRKTMQKSQKLCRVRQGCVQCGNQLQVVKNILSFNGANAREVQSRVCVNPGCPNWALLAVPLENMPL